MTTFDHPVAQAIAWALVHFTWQGAVLGLLAYVLLRRTPLGAASRYSVGVAILFVMLAAPVVTTAVLVGRADAVPVATVGTAFDMPAASAPPAGLMPDGGATAESLFETAVLGAWLAGVVVLGIRLFGGWVVTRRLTSQSVRPASPELESMARRVAGRLALETTVRIVESTRIAVPMLVGWVKPVVLLPAASLTGLTPTQIEALLAHELAHVRRHDYLVNMLQAVAETLLFYHPAVWWVSRQVRAEREHCCDDIAVGICDRLEYVSALASLAAATAVPSTALAATDGSLVGRVRRLLASERHTEPVGAASWPAAALVALTLVGGAVLVPLGIRAGSAPASGEQTPVADARPAGLPGDVGGGVSQGVAGGVPDRVAGEPADVVAQGADVRQDRPAEAAGAGGQSSTTREREQAAEEALRQRALAIEREYREVQRRIELERLELALRQATAEQQLLMQSAEADVEVRRKELAALRSRIEVGLERPELAAQMELQLREAERQLMSARNALEIQNRDFDLRRKEVDLRANYERQLAELGVRHGRLEEARAAEVAAVVDAAEKALRERALREEALAREHEVAAQAERLDEIDAATPIRAGDLVHVEIADEPFLPREYAIGDDGNIRLPFLGGIRAVGQTATQVRDQIVRELRARNLKAEPVVHVRVGRPRG